MTETKPWDGSPENPEKSGWHHLKGLGSLSNPRPFFWEVFIGAGRWADERLDDPVILAEMEYLGPCLTPAEVEARVAEARRAGLEEAVKWHEERALKLGQEASLARNFRQLLGKSDFHMCSATDIRALMEKKDD